MRIILATFLITHFLSCASQKSSDQEMGGMVFRQTEDGVIELVDRADEEIKKVNESVAPTFIYDDQEQIKKVKSQANVVVVEAIQTEVKKVDEKNLELVDSEIVNYKVEKGENLMLIAQKLYQDYSKWKQIYELNKNTIAQPEILKTGSILKVKDPQKSLNDREGSPYLISNNNDTLQKISKKLYGSSRYWYHLWFLNRELITNPDKIYLGFTIYYLPKDTVKKNLKNYISNFIFHFQNQ
ncbi:MAG: LysM peptidoglycan-binding domain-containing protein [Halobacteriovoraceae bacterium]|nr:LysM peptidoglycan-binding domain-containing protein [Halobacteriovoraceae bacterium]